MDGMFFVYLQTFETGDWPVSKLPAAHPMPKENHGADLVQIHAHVGNALTVGERNVSVDVVERLLIFVWTAIVSLQPSSSARAGRSWLGLTKRIFVPISAFHLCFFLRRPVSHVGNALTVGERNVSVDVVERLLIFVWTAIVIMKLPAAHPMPKENHGADLVQHTAPSGNTSAKNIPSIRRSPVNP
jgi:hypothetical protein